MIDLSSWIQGLLSSISSIITNLTSFGSWLYSKASDNTIVAGIVGGLIGLFGAWIGSWLFPKLSERLWNKYLPDVYVTATNAVTFKNEIGEINQSFGLVLRLENNKDTPISFFTPEFYVHMGSWFNITTPQWREALLAVPTKIIQEKTQDEMPRKVVFMNGVIKSVMHSKNIRLDSHDLVDDYIVFYLTKEPTYYKWPSLFANGIHNIGHGEWAVGKIVIKPVGSKPISKNIYFQKTVVRDNKNIVKPQARQTIEVWWGNESNKHEIYEVNPVISDRKGNKI